MALIGREMRSLINENGTAKISLEEVEIAEPDDDEVIVRVEAAPINPTDLGLLLGPADISSYTKIGNGNQPALTFAIPPDRLASFKARFSQSLPIGTEGAGTVIRAGRNAVGLEGKRVGMFGGGMYADYRCIDHRDVIPLPSGTPAADGAAMFVNPLTALGFVETARKAGHKAIIHTAAASNLGQMLQKICLADDIPLINIVRSQEQVGILRNIGAVNVLNSQDTDFVDHLMNLIDETDATVVFDAIGGGALGSEIMQSMERVALRRMSGYNRYGSDTFKELYIYGALDFSPTVLNRLTFGWEWRVSGWLLFPFLRKAGPKVEGRMRERVASELGTTFVSKYTRTIGLAEALERDVMHAYKRMATGEKFLIDPSRG